MKIFNQNTQLKQDLCLLKQSPYDRYPTKAIMNKIAKIISQQVYYLNIGDRKRDLIEKDKLRDQYHASNVAFMHCLDYLLSIIIFDYW